jgi:hypothetical protein
MRGRSRAKAADYFTAALLELLILGIFVIIAQPQLRQALLEIVEPTSASKPLQLGSTQNITPTNWSLRSAGYAPFESFPVSDARLPGTLSSVDARPVDARPFATNPQVEQRVAKYAPTASASELVSSEWNIAAAVQSPRPLSGWGPARSVETAYREAYPPPYGTQSQWK